MVKFCAKTLIIKSLTQSLLDKVLLNYVLQLVNSGKLSQIKKLSTEIGHSRVGGNLVKVKFRESK